MGVIVPIDNRYYNRAQAAKLLSEIKEKKELETSGEDTDCVSEDFTHADATNSSKKCLRCAATPHSDADRLKSDENSCFNTIRLKTIF